MRANPNRPLEERRGEVERTQEMTGRVFRVWGKIEVVGAGEATHEVSFPIWFTEQPSISGGGHLKPNEPLEDGIFPHWDVGVARWRTVDKNLGRFWVGAQLVLVVGGRENQGSFVHWQVEAKGLRNPIATETV